MGLSTAWAGPDGKMVERNFEPLPASLKGKGFVPVLRSVDNLYPVELRRARIEGSATVKVFVTQDGKLEKCEIARSSGDQRVDQAAMLFAQAMQYKVMSPSGVPRSWTDEVPLTFKLAERAGWVGAKYIKSRPNEWTGGS